MNLLQDRRLRQRDPAPACTSSAHPVNWLERQAHHRGPRAGLRLHPVHDPAAVRRRSTASTRACSRPAAIWARAASETFRRVTLPLSKPAILARARDRVAADVRRLLHERPALGTSPKTSMFGNLIDNAVTTAGQGPEAGSLVIILMILADHPDALLPARDQASGGGTMSEMARRPRHRGRQRPRRAAELVHEPVAQAALPGQALTWSTSLWSLVPVVIAMLFSFNAGRSRSTWQGFSLRWWIGGPRSTRSCTTRRCARRCSRRSARRCSRRVVAVPLGVAVRDRHRPLARSPGAGAPTS